MHQGLNHNDHNPAHSDHLAGGIQSGTQLADHPTAAAAPATTDDDNFAPGVSILCRDELWLITQATKTNDGWRLQVRGLSDFVRDLSATFYTALDTISIFDPASVTVEPDNSPGFRQSRLWLESVLRSTPVPLHQDELNVATRMLLDPLEYQLQAVRTALDPQRTRPRILLADAVGLGKTLEIGMILAELIRRGRGSRILVVTPRHVLEQFQQELWTRFAIPLVRLDSQGIAKVRQQLPASQNPFTYFPRVIISMDTLKSPKYRAQLEKVSWDAVVIDEIHNATNAGTQNNQLARTLAPTTEALILASATPHNGDPESFKEILRLLDPLAVRPDGSIDEQAAKRLIIRRHRNTPEVASRVGDKWKERLEPINLVVPASPEEAAVAKEIHDTWIAPEHGATSAQDHLFAWTLVKAFLSSPAALEQTIEQRSRNQRAANNDAELANLARLEELNAKVTAKNSAKYAQLKDYLKHIGIAKGSATRVVIFSERVTTLYWLQSNLAKDMKLGKDAIAVMHGGLSDQEQMALIDAFKRESSPIRVLITGDVASEGVNLHAQCHNLVHYDIPWSLIRIQQRNGRIDRYGQMQSPQIATLLLDVTDGEDGENSNPVGELHVLTRLVEREQAAYDMLGDAASLMGKHDVRAEENAIRGVLAGQKAFDDVVSRPEDVVARAQEQVANNGAPSVDELMALLDAAVADTSTADSEGSVSPAAPSTKVRKVKPSLYDEEVDYLTDALDEAFYQIKHDSPEAGGVSFKESDNGIVEFIPPADLQRRFDFLPQDYVQYRHLNERLLLATTVNQGEHQLQLAREGDSQKTWPKAHFLGPLHPVTRWAVDRALSKMPHDQIPACRGNVDKPTVFLMGTLTNFRGQVVTRSFHIAIPSPFAQFSTTDEADTARVVSETIDDPYRWLRDAGLEKGAISVGDVVVSDEDRRLVKDAVASAYELLEVVQRRVDDVAGGLTKKWQARAQRWEAEASQRVQGSRIIKRSADLIRQEDNILRLSTPERALIRPLLLVLPQTIQDAAHS